MASDLTKQQLMFSLIEIWKQGEKSQQEFCREKELDYHQFQYWFRKHRALYSEMKTDSKFFKQIKLEAPAKLNTSAVELVFPDGRRLIFNQPVEAAFLRSLLS